MPAEGEVRVLEGARKAKLAALSMVLSLHGRDGIYALKVVDVPFPTTALHEWVVLLITLPALDLLSERELQALAAHEIGHEYVWQSFASAKARGDRKRLHELELVCDIVAAETLLRLGIPAKSLLSALQKASDYNRRYLGLPPNKADYPSMRQRRRNVGAWMRQFEGFRQCRVAGTSAARRGRINDLRGVVNGQRHATS
jgi:Zn-dependent protease with chaperone function